MKIGIVTDSTCDLPEKITREYGIGVIPILVRIDGKEYRDGVDLSPSSFYTMLQSSNSAATTSQPAPGAFKAFYEEMLKKYDALISIHMSKSFSGTVQTARYAVEGMGNPNIHVVDSHIVSMGMGALVLQAARDVQKGFDVATVIRRVEQVRQQVRLFVALSTLEYLHKGGRIGKMTAFLGSLLKIRPLLEAVDGEVKPLARCRSRRDAVETLLHSVDHMIRAGQKYFIAVMHTTAETDADEMEKILKERYPGQEYFLGQAGPVLGCHVGPDAFAVMVTPVAT
jgi:DegV family protein with EDD domain